MEDMDRPTVEDMAYDIEGFLCRCQHFHQQSECNHRNSKSMEPSGTGYPEFLHESPLVAEIACKRALFAEQTVKQLLVLLDRVLTAASGLQSEFVKLQKQIVEGEQEGH